MSLSYYQPTERTMQRLQARQTAEAYRANVQPSETTAQRIDALFRAYPLMPAGQIMAFASDHSIDLTSEEVQKIADASLDKERKTGAFDSVGGFLGGIKNIAGKVLTPAGEVVSGALEEFDEHVATRAKATVRTGFVVLETPFQELQTFVRHAGWAGVKTDEDLGADSAMDRILNTINPTKWDDWARNVGRAYEIDAGGSSGRETVSALLRGDKVDLGSGFLPAGNADPEKGPLGIEPSIRARAGRLTLDVGNVSFGGPDNLGITPGRVLAATVAEPGERQFNILSGLTDAGVAWFGDPVVALGGAARSARAGQRVGRAGRAFRDTGSLARGYDELATHPNLVDVGRTSVLGHTRRLDTSLQSRAAETIGNVFRRSDADDIIDDLTGRVTSTTGGRQTVQPDVASGWLGKGGQRVADRIAETSDYHDLRAATGGKLGHALTRELADIDNPQQVLQVLEDNIGRGIREAPEFLGFKVKAANRQGYRILKEMPGTHLDPSDMDQSIDHLERWLRNAKVTPELRKKSINRLAYNDDRPATVTIMGEIMDDVAGELVEKGVRPRDLANAQSRARELTKMWNGDIDKVKAYASDEIIENRKALGVMVGDEYVQAQSPFLLSEYLNSVVPLPDARDIRRATSSLSRLVDNPLFKRTTGVIDGLNGTWKKLALLRGAYTVRVVGEEQVRMASSGLDSMFAHPISFLAALVGDSDKTYSKYIGKSLGTGRLRQADVTGEAFYKEGAHKTGLISSAGAEAASDELAEALNKAHGGWLDDAVFDRNHSIFRPEDDGYQRAWAQSIGELHGNSLAREIARAEGNLEDVKDWFYRRQGRGHRKQMIEPHPELATPAGSDEYVETVAEIVRNRTGDDPALLQAIATGRIGEARIGGMADTGRYAYSPELMAHLDEVAGPAAVKGQKMLKGAGTPQVGEAWDNAMNWAFTHLMTKPTNYLSRSPSFRQRYWQRIEEQLPYMDEGTRAKAMANAEGVVAKDQLKRMRQSVPSNRRKTRGEFTLGDLERKHSDFPSYRAAGGEGVGSDLDALRYIGGADDHVLRSYMRREYGGDVGSLVKREGDRWVPTANLAENHDRILAALRRVRDEAAPGQFGDFTPDDYIAVMERIAPKASTSLITELDDADMIAKAFALDETKKLLYDMTERSQFFDAARLIFPFGEAWKEVVTRWAKIGAENPRVLRRGQQLINGARGNGFFHKDVNGEEVFTFPLSQQLSQALIGVPVPLSGRVAGLSLMTEVMPGVGPVVQVSSAAFLPEGSEWNWAREFISPYGEADYSQGFVESFLPGWTKNGLQAMGSGSEKQRNSTISQVYDHLLSTGEYDISIPEEQARLFADAKQKGSHLFALRAMTQFFAPSSPMPDTLVESEGADEMLVRREVIADLYKLQDELGYDEGMAEFVDRYGVKMLGTAQGMSKSLAPVLPVTKEASDWVRDNGDLVKDFKLTWGMFAPNKDTDEIDLTEYGRQIDAGDRKPLTVEQRAALANAKVGRYIFAQQEAKMPEKPTKEQRDWLAAIKEKIRQQYPGYGKQVVGVPTGADLDVDVIPELRRVLLDKRVSSTGQAKALRLYLGARDKALAFAEEEYGTKLGSQAAEPLRQWLGTVARRISAQHPEFAGVFDRTFSYELEA